MFSKLLAITLLLLSSCSWTPTEPEKEKLTIEWAKDTNLLNAPTTIPLVIEGNQIVYTGEPELVSLRATTGKELWRAEIDGESDLESKSLLHDEKMERIVSNHFNSFYVWDANDGRLLFSVNGEDGLRVFRHGRNSILDDGYALVGDTLDAYIINKDGSIRFRIDVEFGTSGISYHDKKVYISQIKTINGALTVGKIRAFDSQSGDSLWSFYTEHGGFEWSAPIVENGVVYAGTYLGNPSRVYALDAENGDKIWERSGFSTHKMTTSDDRIYINTSGSLQAIDKMDGNIAWSITFEGSGFGNIVCLNGYVYHIRSNEMLIIDDSTGEVVHREPVPQGGGYFWHVAASSDKIFAQTSRQLIAYEPWHLRE